MPKNSESLNRSLFDLLHSKGYDPTMLDTSGKEIPTPEEAEVFQFDFIKDGENYGKVTISIDGAHKLIIYFNDKVADSEKEETGSGDVSWYQLLNQLKRFAQSYQLSFELRNVDNLKHDMAKRVYMKKKESVQEGYYPMGKKASYSDNVPNVKMIIQHSRQIEEGEQRYRNVERIFLENEQGERFLAPTTKPGIARVYARHIAEGGNPHDERWNHIGSLCEEYQKMGAFVRATRNGQFNESTQRLVTEGVNHYQQLRENLSKLAGHRGYNAYFESYTPALMEDEGSIDLSEMFMSSSLDPRIESVMPILAKLSKNITEMAEVDELTEWADSLIEGGGGGEASQQPVEPIVSEEESLTSNNPQGIPEDEDDLDEGLDPEKKARLNDLIDAYTDATDPEYMGDDDHEDIIAQIRAEFGDRTANSIANGPSMHFPRPGYSTGHDDLEFKQMRKNMSPNRITKTGKLHKQDSDAMKRDIKNKFEVEEGVLDTLKKVGGKVLDKLGHEDDVLKDLQKKAGIPSHAQHGKPNMAHPKDEERIEEVDMGQADSSLRSEPKQNHDKMDHFTALGKASKKLGHAHYMDVPDDKLEALRAMVKRFRAGETVEEAETPTHKGGKVIRKDGVTKHQSGAGVYGGYDDTTHPDSPEEKHAEQPGRKTGHSTDQIKKFKFNEGEGNFAKAMDTLGGWHQEQNDEGQEVFYFDDREGGYYADGVVRHNPQTGKISIDFEDKSGDYGGDIKGTFSSIGDAMNILRGTFIARHGGGEAHNFDTLGGRSIAGPNDVHKTDRAGKKGTLTKSRMDGMKMSSPYSMRGGPKGVLPEEALSEMDKNQTPSGRDGSGASHGTYGSRDKKDPDAGKKQYTAKGITAKQATTDATDMLNKAFKGVDNKKDVKEGQEDLDTIRRLLGK